MFMKGQSIPRCQLMMVWKGDGNPVRLEYKIVLNGTKPSSDNFLLLVLDPAEGTIYNNTLSLVTVLLVHSNC